MSGPLVNVSPITPPNYLAATGLVAKPSVRQNIVFWGEGSVRKLSYFHKVRNIHFLRAKFKVLNKFFPRLDTSIYM